jgi:hypothetical protein
MIAQAAAMVSSEQTGDRPDQTNAPWPCAQAPRPSPLSTASLHRGGPEPGRHPRESGSAVDCGRPGYRSLGRIQLIWTFDRAIRGTVGKSRDAKRCRAREKMAGRLRLVIGVRRRWCWVLGSNDCSRGVWGVSSPAAAAAVARDSSRLLGAGCQLREGERS